VLALISDGLAWADRDEGSGKLASSNLLVGPLPHPVHVPVMAARRLSVHDRLTPAAPMAVARSLHGPAA